LASESRFLLRVSGLRVRYGLILALDGVSIDVKEGEIVSIIGANGAGKSTLMKAIMNLVRKETGRVEYRASDITGTRPYKIPLSGISYVPEGRQLFAKMSVRENLEMGMVSLRGRGLSTQAELERVYRMFPILATRESQLAGTLSGGEQQMLAMGRALMARPEFCLLDEPSLGLAPLIQRDVFHAIAALRANGVSALLVEQNAKKALEISDRCYVLELGKVTLEGPSRDLAADPRVEKAYLGG
jgi:branched-chain amino acid transport system ATP-binding protein